MLLTKYISGPLSPTLQEAKPLKTLLKVNGAHGGGGGIIGGKIQGEKTKTFILHDCDAENLYMPDMSFFAKYLIIQ